MSKEYNGDPIDASWQTAPWNNDGETIDVHDSNGDGEIMTVDWPENATDREDLNEKQRRLITTAARYPSVEEPQELLDLAGLDMSYGYPQQTLINHWPERYWGKKPDRNKSDDDTKRQSQLDKKAKNDVGEIRRRLLDGDSINQMIKEYQEGHEKISKIARGVADDIPDCDTAPIEYQRHGEQGWKKKGGESRMSTQKLRERALSGATSEALAEESGFAPRTVQKKLSGTHGYDAPNSDIPPLEYNNTDDEWQVAEDDTDESDIETDGEQESQTHNVTPDPVRHTLEPESSSLPAWVWAVAGAVFAWIVSKILG